MNQEAYLHRRGQIEHYFDRTAAAAWARLTSDAPVSGVRATVRQGREEMRVLMGSWLGESLAGVQVLDAGCGTGLLSVDLAHRGAHVTAIDLSPTLVSLARERLPQILNGGRVDFHSGDMCAPEFGHFDHLVAMDSLIHYTPAQAVEALAGFASRIRRSMVITFVPKNPLLMTMLTVGRLFPRADRSPAVEPVGRGWLAQAIDGHPKLRGWHLGRSQMVSRGFYTSHALELVRP